MAKQKRALPTLKEPWNSATMADLAQRKASKFFLLVSEDSCREMASGSVPRGVQNQCEHLLSFVTGSGESDSKPG